MGGNLDPAVASTRVAVRKTLNRLAISNPKIAVAVSGGADSLALAAATAFIAQKNGYTAQAVIIDHGLQPAATAAAIRAADQLTSLGMQTTIIPVRVVAAGKGPEAAARKARYSALYDFCAQTKNDVLFTGHTQQDQAEQVLLALARGSGTRALAGIPAQRTLQLDTGQLTLARPFLEITRADTQQACQAQNLAYWNDPHNNETRFLRSRVRTELLPQLTQVLGPQVVQNLARSASLAAVDADFLDAQAAAAFRQVATQFDGQVQLAVAELAALPAALQGRVVRLAAQKVAGASYTHTHTQAVLCLVHAWRGQRALALPGTTVKRVRGKLFVTRQA